MFNNKEKLRGLPCVVLKRCSSAVQAGSSMPNQGRTTDQAVGELDLKVVWEKDLPGVSGSMPGNRSDIDEIIARKRLRNDFKVLLIQDTTRFTRAGQGHGQKLLYDLRAAGILVYFVAEDLLVDDDMTESYASFLFSAGRHTAKMIAYNATHGSTRSFLEERSPYTKRPPYGMDRMYSDGGVDRHIIRNLPDGTQEQINPQTGDVIHRFARNEKTGIPNHYHKQKSERVRLIPGDPRLIAVVHLIFRMRLVDGWTYRRIAKYLNDHGVPSAEGGEWHSTAVKQVLRRPIYIGQGIRGLSRSGIYFNVGTVSPVPSEVDLEELANNKHVKMRRRPRDQWLEQPQTQFAEFLPEELRPLAREYIAKHLAAIADGKPRTGNRDRHLESPFFLKPYLVCTQGHHKMTGRRGGKSGRNRTYGVSRGFTAPRTNNVLARRIPATPLETAVLDVVRQVVLDRPGMEAAILRMVEKEFSQRRHDQKDQGSLRREMMRKRKQLLALCEGITADEDDALSRRIAAVKLEIGDLERRLCEVESQQPPTPTDAIAIAAKLAAELQDLGQRLEVDDIPHIQRLLDILVYRMEADLETKTVELELALPSWVGQTLSHGGVGLDDLSAYKAFNEAHPENAVILGTFRCDRSGRPVCYTCRRLKSAV